MQTVTTIGLDIAKSVFQVHGVDAAGQVVIRRQLKRRSVVAFFQKLPPCLVGIEACASAHLSATLFKTDRSSRSAGPQKRTKAPRCRLRRGARGCEPAPRTPHPLSHGTELSLALPCPAGVGRM